MKTKSLIALVLSTVGLVSTTHAEQSGRGVNKLQRWLPFCFSDRVTDGCDQSALVTGKQKHSNRDYFPMLFDHQHVGMRYKNFKVLTHKIEDGFAPI